MAHSCQARVLAVQEEIRASLLCVPSGRDGARGRDPAGQCMQSPHDLLVDLRSVHACKGQMLGALLALYKLRGRPFKQTHGSHLASAARRSNALLPAVLDLGDADGRGALHARAVLVGGSAVLCEGAPAGARVVHAPGQVARVQVLQPLVQVAHLQTEPLAFQSCCEDSSPLTLASPHWPLIAARYGLPDRGIFPSWYVEITSLMG